MLRVNVLTCLYQLQDSTFTKTYVYGKQENELVLLLQRIEKDLPNKFGCDNKSILFGDCDATDGGDQYFSRETQERELGAEGRRKCVPF